MFCRPTSVGDRSCAAAGRALRVAGLGVVEPQSETISIATQLGGVVREVYVIPQLAVVLKEHHPLALSHASLAAFQGERAIGGQ
jgi:hypothetical protein